MCRKIATIAAACRIYIFVSARERIPNSCIWEPNRFRNSFNSLEQFDIRVASISILLITLVTLVRLQRYKRGIVRFYSEYFVGYLCLHNLGASQIWRRFDPHAIIFEKSKGSRWGLTPSLKPGKNIIGGDRASRRPGNCLPGRIIQIGLWYMVIAIGSRKFLLHTNFLYKAKSYKTITS